MTLRIKEQKYIKLTGGFMNHYYVATSKYIIQRREFWFWWEDIHEEDSQKMAESWLNSYKAIINEQTN